MLADLAPIWGSVNNFPKCSSARERKTLAGAGCVGKATERERECRRSCDFD